MCETPWQCTFCSLPQCPSHYLYSNGAICLESMLVLSYQKKPVSVFFGNFTPLSALTAASTHL